MFSQGLTLTILGMAIVFVFLTLLVVVMIVLSGIIRRAEKKRLEAGETGAGGPAGAGRKTAGTEPKAVAGQKETEAEETVQPAGTGAAGPEGLPVRGVSPEVAAAVGAYVRAGGVLPSSTGEGREDLAAVVAAIASRGGAVLQGKHREIAAAVAAVRSYKNI